MRHHAGSVQNPVCKSDRVEKSVPRSVHSKLKFVMLPCRVMALKYNLKMIFVIVRQPSDGMKLTSPQ